MLRTDRAYRKNLHVLLGDHVPDHVIRKNNKLEKWAYGYNDDYDMVVISKNGTIGDVIEINELKIALPATPKTVRFSHFGNEEQKWTRYDVPRELAHFDKYYKDEKNIASKLKEVFNRHKKFIEEDIHRKFNGDWFMNDNEPMYIPPDYYFFLQHYKLTDMMRYPDFRVPQRDYFIFVEACNADHRCLGSLLLKGRRSSFSTSSGSQVLSKAITYRNGSFPIVSKKDTDAQILFTNHIVKPLLQLPKHLQPLRSGEVMPKSELLFSAPKKKLTTNNKTDSSIEGLDTLIRYYGTTVSAYDGSQAKLSINDEIGKMKGNLNVNEYWEQYHRMCHVVGSEVVGKALCGSTAAPPNQGGVNYEIFYNSSKLSTRNATGQTTTGLYSIFIEADLATMGFFDQWGYAIYENPPEPILNEIGKLVKIGSKEYLDANEAARSNDVQQLNAWKRNNPRVDTDAFLDEEASNMYATIGMVNTINFLKRNKEDTDVKDLTFRFDLYYKDKENKIVEMKRSSNGRFMAIGNLPVPLEFRNKHKSVSGRLAPTNGHLGAFGCDPYQADRTKYNNGSKMGLVGVTSDDYNLNENQRNQTFLYYDYRPNTRDEAEEDIIMACLYFSMPILPEINKKSLVVKFYERNLRKFVLNNPLKLKKELTPDEEKYGGAYSSNSGNSIPEQESALETYIYSNFYEDVEDVQDIKSPFLQLNEKASSYTREKRGSLDTVVAWQLACVANSRKMKKREPMNLETSSIVDIASLFVNDNLVTEHTRLN